MREIAKEIVWNMALIALQMICVTLILISMPQKHIRTFELNKAFISPTYVHDHTEEVFGVDTGDVVGSIYELACVVKPTWPLSDEIPLDGWLQLQIQEYCDHYCVSYPLVLAVIDTETRFKEEYEGNIIGLMQISKKYHTKRADSIGADLYKTEENVKVGVDLLSELLIKYDGEPALALEAYNGGENKAAYAQEVLRKQQYWEEKLR